MKWQGFRNYEVVIGPNNGSIMEYLFNEDDGGMIR